MAPIRRSSRVPKPRDYWDPTNSPPHQRHPSAFIIYTESFEHLSTQYFEHPEHLIKGLTEDLTEGLTEGLIKDLTEDSIKGLSTELSDNKTQPSHPSTLITLRRGALHQAVEDHRRCRSHSITMV